MAYRTNAFTGSDGAAWPTSTPSGSWTQVSDPANSATGASRVINGNRGRIQYSSTTVGSATSSHLDRANYKPASFEFRANVVRNNLYLSPGILFRTSATTAASDCYRVLGAYSDDNGKTYGLSIAKRVGGTVTILSGATVAHGLTLATDDATPFNFAVRVVQRSSDVWICAKIWTGTEPAWPAVGSTGYSSSNQVCAVLDSTSGLWDASGGVALYTYWNNTTGSATSIRWDDVEFRDLAVGAAAIAGTGTLNASGTYARVGAANLTGAGSSTAAAIRTAFGAAALSGSGVLAGAGTRVTYAAAALDGVGSLTATAAATDPKLGAAALTGSGNLSASATRTAPAAAALTGAGTLTVAGVRTVLGAAALSGVGSLTATPEIELTPDAYFAVSLDTRWAAVAITGRWAAAATPGRTAHLREQVQP